MSGPYHLSDMFLSPDNYQPLVCPDPENCTELHNEAGPDGEEHHYECECGWCQYVMWSLK